jgi:Tol biopolymer transport system component
VLLIALIGGALLSQPSIAMAAGRIVWQDAYGGTGLYTTTDDAGDRMHLTDDGFDPHWLPDGSGISFVLNTGPRGGRSRLVRVDPDGTGRVVLIDPTEIPSGWVLSGHSWSPDASRLVVGLASVPGGRRQLFAVEPDGSGMTRIAKDAGQPDWSSTGRIVAIRDDRLITLDPDGSDLERVRAGMQATDPRWSPDGSKLVFMCGATRSADVCTVNADGSGLLRLTRSDRTDWSPTWSPDGLRILWSPETNEYGEYLFRYSDLFRMRADGTGVVRLTRTRAIDEFQPDWNANA